jgi:peptidyl-prolyl cis-trans isomerase-like protein 2
MGFTSTIGGAGLKGGKEKKPVYLNPKKGEKGYVSLDIQQFGSLNLELHCDIAPRTCENFLHLCEKGFYDGVKFHRNVPNFMIQGGDPTGTGKKGFSIYGETFKDEFGLQKGVLSHKERGIVSMANKGKDTNNSQFFITYGKNLTHLDGKHTIFGRVVGGLKVLDELEDIEADDKDPEKPGVDIIIEKTTVHQNPWTKLEKEYEDKRGGVADIKTANATMAVKTNTEKKMEEEEEKKKKMGPKIVGSGIGRFVTGSTANVNATKFMNSEEIEEEEEERRRKKAKATTTSAKRKGGFGNFESW